MDREFLTDLFADFGPVTLRRMFSGYGISADGINFALAPRAGLYFRADGQNSKAPAKKVAARKAAGKKVAASKATAKQSSARKKRTGKNRSRS